MASFFFLREKRKADEPRVEAITKENEGLNAELLSQRDLQLGLLQEIEALKHERASLVQRKVRNALHRNNCRYRNAYFRAQKGLDTETAIAADGVTRVRSRIVQSPERKRRNISTMRESAAEDKRTHVALLERQRELRVKVAALKNIAKVLQRVSPLLFCEFFFDLSVTGCEDVCRGTPDSAKRNGRPRRRRKVITRYSRLLRQAAGRSQVGQN